MKVLAIVALIAFWEWVPETSATVIHSRCGKFFCPDHCEISYQNGCPHNCNCKKDLTLCPKITCPAPAPTCLIYTQLDGCQSCACERPFIGSSAKPDPTVDAADFITIAEEKAQGRLQPPSEAQLERPSQPDVQKEPERFQFPDPADPIFSNPQPQQPQNKPKPKEAPVLKNSQINKEDRNSFNSQERQRSRFQPQQRPRLPQFPRKEDQRRRNQVGELRIQDSQLGDELLQQQSRAPVSAPLPREPWDGPRATPRRRPVVQPQTPPARSSEESEDILSPKDAAQCTAEHQAKIVQQFSGLYREIVPVQDKVSAAFPVAFAFNSNQLQQKCDIFKNAMHSISPEAKRSCIRRFEVYDIVYFGLGYPCGYGTRDYFLRYFDCLVDVKQNSAVVRRCEELANHRLSDASVDVCETYNVLANCMYDTVVKACGYDGWEIEYQYLSMNLRNQHDCRLKRIFRTIQMSKQTNVN